MQPPPSWWFVVVPAVFVAVFFFWPLLTILARGLSPEGLALLGRASTWRILGFTTWQALLSTVLTVAVGLPAAYALHRLSFRGRRSLLVLLTVPFVLPTVVVGTAFRALLPQAWVGTLGAILLAHVFFNLAVVVPFVINSELALPRVARLHSAPPAALSIERGTTTASRPWPRSNCQNRQANAW